MNMGPMYSVSFLTLVLIFAAGVAVGRILRPTKINLARSFTPHSRFGVSRVKILKVKCQCGENLEFRDPPDLSHPNSLAIPVGDSITCPKCARVIDLSEFRAEGPNQSSSE
jgi:hypothetical protein